MRYRRAAQTAWRAIADETIVLDLASKRMVGLNATGAFVWQNLEVFDRPGAMYRALTGHDADTGNTTASSISIEDLETFLRDLLDSGLIERVEPDRAESEAEPQGAEPGRQRPVDLEPPPEGEPPRIEWRETVEQIAATCAFFPAQNPLCTQVPFS